MKVLRVKVEVETWLYEIRTRLEQGDTPISILNMLQKKMEKLVDYSKRDYIKMCWNSMQEEKE